MKDNYMLLCVIVIAAVTAALRFVPFAVFGKKETPKLIVYLGKVLPYAVMGMLVVYCLRNVSFSEAGKWAPALIGCAVTAALYTLKKNTLLSIVGGTLCYMALIQFVFV